VIEFVTVASEYCGFAEKPDRYNRKDFIDKSQKLLALIYLKASLLPGAEPVFDSGNEKFVTEQDWFRVQDRISVRLGDYDHFIKVGDPIMQFSDDTVSVSISEIFADIYQDLTDFISLYRVGAVEIMNDALWECRLNFEQYWGQRLLGALSALHTINFGREDPDGEE
ncbi:MAG: DUF5063 domain-containing protein, partial [Bacteroidetes bacterium]|nr:DUF5063 domain-containing protein [Bacteroidota bacterium]